MAEPGEMGADGAEHRPAHHTVGDAVELGIDGLCDVSIVGSGGSSTVYRARQPALDRTVAIKVVHGAWSIETRERFEHERRVTGRLSGHAAIVPIFATGITKRGEPYLLMPFYRRGSLFRLMKDRGPLPWREAGFILETLSQAVADCHDAGIVHRDVKPGNVLLTDHVRPRLGDFGITLPDGAATAGSTVAYTPSYSPPEAFEAGIARPTIDVYGLGATLWALLAGRAPFTEPGETVDVGTVIDRSSNGDIGPPGDDAPEPICALLRRAMAREPQRRPADAGVFAAELRRAVRLSEQGAGRARGRVPDRHRGRAAVVPMVMITAGILLVLAGGAWMLFR